MYDVLNFFALHLINLKQDSNNSVRKLLALKSSFFCPGQYVLGTKRVREGGGRGIFVPPIFGLALLRIRIRLLRKTGSGFQNYFFLNQMFVILVLIDIRKKLKTSTLIGIVIQFAPNFVPISNVFID